MGKKTLFVAIILILFLVVGFLWFTKKENKNKPNISNNNSKNQNDSISNQNVYKTVIVNNDKISFSFEISNDWLTETRNARGYEAMTEGEMREFLATSYSEKPEEFPDQIKSDYANLSWNEIKAMNFDEMKKLVVDREKIIGLSYPNASISSKEIIGYRGPNRYQIDFYVLPKNKVDMLKKELANRSEIKRKSVVIAEKKTDIYEYPTEKDRDGNSVFSPESTGGSDYFINNGDYYIFIKKQALGESESFQHIMESLLVK